MAFGAALTISDLVDRRSAENLIQPSAPKRNRAQQHGSGFRPKFEPFKGVSENGDLLGGAEAAGSDDPVGNIMQFTIALMPRS